MVDIALFGNIQRRYHVASYAVVTRFDALEGASVNADAGDPGAPVFVEKKFAVVWPTAAIGYGLMPVPVVVVPAIEAEVVGSWPGYPGEIDSSLYCTSGWPLARSIYMAHWECWDTGTTGKMVA